MFNPIALEAFRHGNRHWLVSLVPRGEPRVAPTPAKNAGRFPPIGSFRELHGRSYQRLLPAISSGDRETALSLAHGISLVRRL